MDDIIGQPINPELCRRARQEELNYFKSKGVWDLRAVKEAWTKTGRPPITVGGDDENPKIRSRLVACEIRMAGTDSIFAPTPPLESLRMVLSYAVTDLPDEPRKIRDPRSPDRTQVLLIDISRAYFKALTSEDEPTYVELPPEAGVPTNTFALLKKHMYGTRRAAEAWQHEYSESLRSIGFTQGAASACVFRHKQRQLVCSVHGDDFTVAGPCRSLDWFEEAMKHKYELTIGGRLGPGPSDAKEIRVLNHIARWTPRGIEYEADPRQVEKSLQEIELEGANGAAPPGQKVLAHQLEAEVELPERDFTRFRALAARANYLAADRIDVLYAAK